MNNHGNGNNGSTDSERRKVKRTFHALSNLQPAFQLCTHTNHFLHPAAHHSTFLPPSVLCMQSASQAMCSVRSESLIVIPSWKWKAFSFRGNRRGSSLICVSVAGCRRDTRSKHTHLICSLRSLSLTQQLISYLHKQLNHDVSFRRSTEGNPSYCQCLFFEVHVYQGSC